MLGFARELDLVPELGYRVRTLHGLAHDIVRENPPLAELDKQFTIIDDTASVAMIGTRLAPGRTHTPRSAPRMFEVILRKVGQTQLPNPTGRSHRDSRNELHPVGERQSPISVDTAAELEGQVEAIPLAFMGVEIYTAYQKGLTYRGAVDFDDLIRLAAGMLDQSQICSSGCAIAGPCVLEDEAQGLQPAPARDLVRPRRALRELGDGDPNQAIFETFTTAHPDLLREFISRNPSVPMPRSSGRCQPSIIELANRLIIWTVSAHPVADVRSALAEPLIKPALPTILKSQIRRMIHLA